MLRTPENKIYSEEWGVRGKHLTQLKYAFFGFAVLALSFVGLFIARGPVANEEELAVLNSGDTAFMLCCCALVLLMTPGLAYFYGGMVHHGSVISTMLQCFICMGLVGFFWIIYGFSLAFGEDAGRFIGNPATYFWFRDVGTAPNPDFAATIPFQLYAIFQLKFATLTPALTSGGIIERIRFGPYLVWVILFMTVIYCPIAHWVWHPAGFLRYWGVKDFAGGAPVHMASGWAALAGAIVLGRRESVKRGEKAHPYNPLYVMLGTGMLWFGWFGFNAGSELAADQIATQAFLNTNTASASGMLMWMSIEGMIGEKPSSVGACIGAVVGLVVVTPAAGYIDVGQSLFFGSFGAIISFITLKLLRMTKIDDGLDAFACHGMGGITGTILTGAFELGGPVDGNFSTFGFSWACVCIVFMWAFGLSLIILFILNLLFGLRTTPEEERIGLDETQHDEGLHRGHWTTPDDKSAPFFETDDVGDAAFVPMYIGSDPYAPPIAPYAVPTPIPLPIVVQGPFSPLRPVVDASLTPLGMQFPPIPQPVALEPSFLPPLPYSVELQPFPQGPPLPQF